MWDKTETHFEWLLWHWSSLGQLNLEPTRPNGLVGCKVPTDLVKISVKEATHMGFHYRIHWGPVNSPHKWPVTRKIFPFDDVIMINAEPRDRFQERFFHPNSNSMEFLFCSHPGCSEVIRLWNVAHGTATVLLWHVQFFLAIWYSTMELD